MWVLIVYMSFGYNGGMTSVEMRTHDACERAALKYVNLPESRSVSCIDRFTGETIFFPRKW